MSDKIRKMINTYKNGIFMFIKFNAVGVLNTLIDFSVFTLLKFLNVGNLQAQVISYSCGMINSYVLNRNWTFATFAKYKNNKNTGIQQGIRFIVINLLSLGVSIAVLYFMSNVLKANVVIGKTVATIFAIIVNFFGNKMWVFK